MEKTIILASYDGAEIVKFHGKEYPFDAVVGFRINEKGEISGISLDSQKYSRWLDSRYKTIGKEIT